MQSERTTDVRGRAHPWDRRRSPPSPRPRKHGQAAVAR
jgi:hypothetical protein